jgi:hypothetical protein
MIPYPVLGLPLVVRSEQDAAGPRTPGQLKDLWPQSKYEQLGSIPTISFNSEFFIGFSFCLNEVLTAAKKPDSY